MASERDWFRLDHAHRPALDGFRTIAVYLVLAFHAGMAKFENGFVGVDAFFVLSGFLITRVLVRDLEETGHIRFRRFYSRRFRRLLPAALMVVVAVIALAVVALPAIRREAVAGDAQSSLLYYANWHFIGSATDYFASNSTQHSPLLHFWSLSVEEQFYFVYPVFLAVAFVWARRLNRRSVVLLLVGAATLASFSMQIFWSERNPLRAYYGTDAKVYQMTLGAMAALALAVMAEPSGSRARVARVVGPALLGGLVLVGTSTLPMSTTVRGLVAALLTVGVILSLESAQCRGPAVQLLSTGWFQYLGRISYGTYLWHWPLIVFLRERLEISPKALAAMTGVLSTGLAALSAQLIEMPVRTAKGLGRRQWAVIAVALASSVGATVAIHFVVAHSESQPTIIPKGLGAATAGTPSVAPPSLDAIKAARAAVYSPPFGKTLDCVGRPVVDCTLVEGDSGAIAVFGDSHARMLLAPLSQYAEDMDLSLVASTANSCPWQVGLIVADRTEEATRQCADQKSDFYDRILGEVKPDVLFLAEQGASDPKNVWAEWALLEGNGSDPLGEFSETTDSTLSDLLRKFDGKIAVFEPVPLNDVDATECLSSGISSAAQCNFDPGPVPSDEDTILRRTATSDPRILTIDNDALACPGVTNCEAIVEGQIVRWDEAHLTTTYLLRQMDQFVANLRDSGVL